MCRNYRERHRVRGRDDAESLHRRVKVNSECNVDLKEIAHVPSRFASDANSNINRRESDTFSTMKKSYNNNQV